MPLDCPFARVMLALLQHKLAGHWKGGRMETLEPWITPAISIAGFAFLWRELVRLRERMDRLEVSLRERMARLEGLFEGFTKRPAPTDG